MFLCNVTTNLSLQPTPVVITMAHFVPDTNLDKDKKYISTVLNNR